eukprot:gene46178-56535_t
MSEQPKETNVAEKVEQVAGAGKADDSPSAAAPAEPPAIDVKSLSPAELVRFLQMKEFERQKARYDRSLLKGKDVPKEHKFWNTQPMPALTEEIIEGNGPINATMTVDQVRAEPLNMPAGFEWCDLD